MLKPLYNAEDTINRAVFILDNPSHFENEAVAWAKNVLTLAEAYYRLSEAV